MRRSLPSRGGTGVYRTRYNARQGGGETRPARPRAPARVINNSSISSPLCTGSPPFKRDIYILLFLLSLSLSSSHRLSMQ